QAADRSRELVTLLGATPEGTDRAERLAHELAWLRDDHTRATARVTELHARLTRLPPDPRDHHPAPPRHEPPGTAAPSGPFGHAHPAEPADRPVPDRAVAGRRRPRGARYAWLDDDADAAAPAPSPEVGALPGLSGAAAGPRGARFGGADAPSPEPAPVPAPEPEPGPGDRASVARAVTALQELRAQSRTGEAHALLCEAARWPAPRLPLLADALHAAGLDADWATLLWEAASLPTDRLAALAGALAGAGRGNDARQLLRQGVARPGEDTAAAVLALHGNGRDAEARALVETLVDARPPEDAARFAAQSPARLVPQVLDAVRAVAPAREPAFVHALRVAGLVAT
uniref:UL36 very large tegument protein n=1 Tax=Streptomyces sp. TRM64462 TaxID=2741726 RepID=UPI001586199E